MQPKKASKPAGPPPNQGSAGKKPRGPRLTERKKREMLLKHENILDSHGHRLAALETKSWWTRMFG